jgi:hypothetical protein
MDHYVIKIIIIGYVTQLEVDVNWEITCIRRDEGL